MDKRLLALELFLEALEIPTQITSLRDRKRLQKAVYLGQLSGVHLGYSHGWYFHGPYSPSLTRDYYKLAENEKTEEQQQLKASVIESLAKIKPLLVPPTEFPNDQVDWLELLASFHYVRKVQGRQPADARAFLIEQKPWVQPYLELAEETLASAGLL